MKKAVLTGGGLVLMFFIVFFSFRQSPEQPIGTHPPAPEKIHLFHYFSGSLSGGLAEMVASVNSRDPLNVVVEQALDHEAFKSMIHTTLDKGSPPELFSYWAGSKTQALIDEGKLSPLDEIWETSALTNRFAAPVTVAASTYNGHKYLLPITQHFVVFFYNKPLFTSLGLTPPSSWQEMVDLAIAFRDNDIAAFALGAKERWPAQFWFDYLLLRAAGPKYRQALMEGLAHYTDEEVQRVYRMWGTLMKDQLFNANANDLDWAEATRLVCSGKAAMTLMGTWAMQLLSGDDCGLAEETGFDFFAFPTVDAHIVKAAVGPVDGLVLTKESSNHEFALKVLSYFAERGPQQRFSEGSGAFAASSEVPESFYSPLRRRILQESNSASSWAFNYDLSTPSDIAEKGLDSFNELIAFPDQSTEILVNLQAEITSLQDNN